MKTKEELLAHYATREPTRFIQIDGFTEEGIWGPFDTWELMQGASIRIFVRPGTTPEEAAKMLPKLSEIVLGALGRPPSAEEVASLRKEVEEMKREMYVLRHRTTTALKVLEGIPFDDSPF